MSAFDLYSEYYNLLYRDKDYRGEVDYILSLIKQFRPGARTLLDIGCGTGKHAALLQNSGLDVSGVDLSETMLGQARQTYPQIAFHQGDARTVRLDKTFDVVTSLFHVASYQTSNADLQDYIQTAKTHLAPGGIFIFDFWYGPGVVSDPPTRRVKHLEDERLKITRTAEPTAHPEKNVVNVHYHVLAERPGGGAAQEITEDHAMRYFFAPELEQALNANGLKQHGFYDWMTNRAPAAQTWNACIVAGF